jgi:hypothetical protein
MLSHTIHMCSDGQAILDMLRAWLLISASADHIQDANITEWTMILLLKWNMMNVLLQQETIRFHSLFLSLWVYSSSGLRYSPITNAVATEVLLRRQSRCDEESGETDGRRVERNRLSQLTWLTGSVNTATSFSLRMTHTVYK